MMPEKHCLMFISGGVVAAEVTPRFVVGIRG